MARDKKHQEMPKAVRDLLEQIVEQNPDLHVEAMEIKASPRALHKLAHLMLATAEKMARKGDRDTTPAEVLGMAVAALSAVVEEISDDED